jgi:5-(carboxyamino)imidazole ribonucleotide synthase
MIHQKKIGILGGGQLGKMLAIAAADWSLDIHGLDPDKEAPAKGYYKTLLCGDFNDYNTVMSFGQSMDIITIEIEHVNTDALKELKEMGKTVHPEPEALEVIKDKGAQKLFYQRNHIPTAPFYLCENKQAILSLVENGVINIPFVQKSRSAGYDGKGVLVVDDINKLEKLFDTSSLIEEMADIDKELAIIVSRNESGEYSSFPAVEMLFNPVENLVENLICPADISEQAEKTCREIAKTIIEKLDICGVLAVEFFLNKDGEIWVNEVAPRPHNSGHHTIEANYTSQYQQHLRSILNLSPGNTGLCTQKAMMVNILGEANHTGEANYIGLEEVFQMSNTYVHIYGKKNTKPMRKMGHVTILDDGSISIKDKAKKVLDTLKVFSK